MTNTFMEALKEHEALVAYHKNLLEKVEQQQRVIDDQAKQINALREVVEQQQRQIRLERESKLRTGPLVVDEVEEEEPQTFRQFTDSEGGGVLLDLREVSSASWQMHDRRMLRVVATGANLYFSDEGADEVWQALLAERG